MIWAPAPRELLPLPQPPDPLFDDEEDDALLLLDGNERRNDPN
jgi:hypothetical protein